MRADSFASENLTASVNVGSARRRGAAATGTGLATRGDDLVPRAARAGGGARGDDLSVWRRLRHRAPQVRARWRAPPRTGVCGGSRRREAWFEEGGNVMSRTSTSANGVLRATEPGRLQEQAPALRRRGGGARSSTGEWESRRRVGVACYCSGPSGGDPISRMPRARRSALQDVAPGGALVRTRAMRGASR